MTTPSQTVQTAQRLLAEREQVGLAKYGTTVDRTDLSAVDWLQHAIEETLDQALYLIRLRETMLCCACKHRPASQCPGEWEPGCDLGNNDAHCVPAPAGTAEAVDAALGIDRPNLRAVAEGLPKLFEATRAQDMNEIVEILKMQREAMKSVTAAVADCVDHEASKAIQQDIDDRAAYLARWKDAPPYANWLSQDSAGWCCWWQAEPILAGGAVVQYWNEGPGLTGDKIYAGKDLLGSVKCERRPKP